jgi:hypothetical protein
MGIKSVLKETDEEAEEFVAGVEEVSEGDEEHPSPVARAARQMTRGPTKIARDIRRTPLAAHPSSTGLNGHLCG